MQCLHSPSASLCCTITRKRYLNKPIKPPARISTRKRSFLFLLSPNPLRVRFYFHFFFKVPYYGYLIRANRRECCLLCGMLLPPPAFCRASADQSGTPNICLKPRVYINNALFTLAASRHRGPRYLAHWLASVPVIALVCFVTDDL